MLQPSCLQFVTLIGLSIVAIINGTSFPTINNNYLPPIGPSLDPISSSPNPFQIVNEWKYLDFDYPTFARRKAALANNELIPQNNLPLGIDVYADRIFVTTPRWKDGVPASLSVLPFPPKELSPSLQPYPNWEEHGDPYNPDCSKLMSVYRTWVDECSRLWLIDAGVVNATVSLNQICPPKIVAYDLRTNKRILSYELPPDQVKQDSLHSNILVDVRDGKCDDAHVYVTDVWRFGIVVYSLAKNRSWRATNYNFNPNPVAADFNVYGLNFQWLDGVFGMSLSPINKANDRILFFHPMASYNEFMVSTSVLRDENNWPDKAQDVAKNFATIGTRGRLGQSSTSGIDRNQVMFFTQVHRDAIGCWDTRKPYTPSNHGQVGAANTSLIQFPNDLKVDQQVKQGVWVMSNRLPIYLYSKLDYSDVNFRILRANVEDAVAGTVCDPNTSAASINIAPQFVNNECY
ncbi:protein yellow-like [Eupeodes corollae]|uniref:protein yellow-like n=1 Tax=Eupeodes corollae TaxID=290404 RepID=UPI0024924A85|nr:protein yellow-like [Eupeodes corollae]